MGVTITFSSGGGADHPLSDRAFWDEHMCDSLHMSNGGAAVLVNILCLSGGRLAETESQKRMMVYLAEQNQNERGLGNIILDIDRIPWDREHFAEDKAFMLRVIEGARQKLGWETLRDRYAENDAGNARSTALPAGSTREGAAGRRCQRAGVYQRRRRNAGG